MAANLTTLIARAQALLLDSGTNFSTATLTAAFREALRRFNVAAPQAAANTIDTVEGQLEYALNDAGFTGLLSVYGVWLQDPTANGENDTPLPAHIYYEDNAPFIRLQQAQAAGGTLIVRYALPHTINGLDSETESTLDDGQDGVLVDGACAIGIETRLASRVETINLAPAVVENYRRAGSYFMDAFRAGLLIYANRPAGVGTKPTAAWNDAYHTFWPAGWDSFNG